MAGGGLGYHGLITLAEGCGQAKYIVFPLDEHKKNTFCCMKFNLLSSIQCVMPCLWDIAQKKIPCHYVKRVG